MDFIKGIDIYQDVHHLEERIDTYRASIELLRRNIGHKEPYHVLIDELTRLEKVKAQLNVKAYDMALTTARLVGVGEPVSAKSIYKEILHLRRELQDILNLRAEVHNRSGYDSVAYKAVEKAAAEIQTNLDNAQYQEYVRIKGL
jgi:hypothetical protein